MRNMFSILSIKNLNVHFLKGKTLIHVIRNVSFDVYEGQTLSIVGESGSGKTIISKTLGCLLDENGIITGGEIYARIDGKVVSLVPYFNSMANSNIKKRMIKALFKNLIKNAQFKISYNHKKLALSSSFKMVKKMFRVLNEENTKHLEYICNFAKTLSVYSQRKARKFVEKLRATFFSYIFQDPSQALNPLLTVGSQIIETIKKQNPSISHKNARLLALEYLTKVGIKEPEKSIKMLPSHYSGGMRQRIVIAIALAAKPKVLIADEPTTALDVTVQKQILDLLMKFKKDYNLTMIFISHDLGVVFNISDYVNVMYAGSFVEMATKKELFSEPLHPYTWALLRSLPQFATKNEKLFCLNGTPPQLDQEWKGDAFYPRNMYALEIDKEYEPPLFQVSDTHFAKTWLLHESAPEIKMPEDLKRVLDFMKRRLDE